MPRLTVNIEGESWLAGARDTWTELLLDSDADKLFLSWAWIDNWWRSYGEGIEGSLRILVAVTHDDQVVGIAPFYRTRADMFGILRRRRIQLAGNIWREDSGVTSERLDWICRNGWRSHVNRQFCKSLKEDLRWDEAIVLFAATDAAIVAAFEKPPLADRCYIREEGTVASFAIATSGGFGAYLQSLSSNSRVRIYNRRARLNERGRVCITYADRDTVDDYLKHLFRLHERRWGRPVPRRAASFLSAICKQSCDSDSLRLSLLAVDNTIVSAILGIVAEDTEYNLQSAFDESFDSRLSLGSLHLGYELERVFDSGTGMYDLLAGGGKRTQFKNRVAPLTETFRSLQFVKNPVLKTVYRCYDFLTR